MKYLTFYFDLSPWVQGQFFFHLSLYGYFIVQFLEKSVEPFRIYHKMTFLTFDFYLLPWGQGHNILFSI